MLDLESRLERLAAEATRDAVPPEPEAIARRGRRRRRRRLAGTAMVVAAVVAAGLVLPARLASRTRPAPAAAPATDVAGAARLGGYWFGKTDATVFLRLHVTAGQRDAVRRRIQSLDVVDEVYYESRADAHRRLQELYRNKPGAIAGIDETILPESFRVRLTAPEHFGMLQRALCAKPPDKARGLVPCMDGVETVLHDKVPLKAVLVPRPWATTSDVTVFLLGGDDAAEVRAVRARLEAIDGVAEVAYETPEEAYRRLPEKLRRDGGNPAKVTPLFSPRAVPAAFHVTLDRPARVVDFHRALCGSRRTGDCPGVLVVLEHPRR
jgi:cell division protein FtsX